MVSSRDRLSAVIVSQEDLLGSWITWSTEPRKAPIRCAVLMNIDAYSSFFTYLSFMPITQLALSVRILMCDFFSFSGVSNSGRSRAIISKVAVLFPKRLPMLSVAVVINFLGHHI